MQAENEESFFRALAHVDEQQVLGYQSSANTSEIDTVQQNLGSANYALNSRTDTSFNTAELEIIESLGHTRVDEEFVE